MTLVNIANAAESTIFRRRVKAAIFTVALEVSNEASTVANHIQRQFLATQIIGDPTTYSEQFAWFIATDPLISNTITGSPGSLDVAATDTDVLTVVRGVWNRVGGIPS